METASEYMWIFGEQLNLDLNPIHWPLGKKGCGGSVWGEPCRLHAATSTPAHALLLLRSRAHLQGNPNPPQKTLRHAAESGVPSTAHGGLHSWDPVPHLGRGTGSDPVPPASLLVTGAAQAGDNKRAGGEISLDSPASSLAGM